MIKFWYCSSVELVCCDNRFDDIDVVGNGKGCDVRFDDIDAIVDNGMETEDGARGILSVFFVVFRRDVDLVGVLLRKVVVFGLIGTGFLPNEEEEAAVEGVALLRREGVTTVGGGGGGSGVVVVSFRTGGSGDGGGAAVVVVVVVVVAAGASFLEKVAIL